MKHTLILLSLLLGIQASAFTEYRWVNGETGIQLQADWDASPINQFPSGSARAKLSVNTRPCFAYVTNSSIAAGLYRLYIKGYSYTNSSAGMGVCVAYGGDNEIIGNIDEKDKDGVWNNIGLLNVPFATNIISFSFYRTNFPPMTFWPSDVITVFMTSNTNSIMTNEGFLQDWNYDTNVNPAIAITGNYLMNSSFEAGISSGGWTIGVNNSRWFSLRDSETAENSMFGLRSMMIPFERCTLGNQLSQTINYPGVRVRPNMVHTLSAYFYSTVAGSTVTLALRNPIALLPGYGLVNQWTNSTAVTLTQGVWQRVTLTNQVLLEYPYATFCPEAIIASVNGGKVYTDGWQLEEGPVATAYAPRTGVEIGLDYIPTAGVYYNDQAISVKLALKRTGSAGSETVSWQLMNYKREVIYSGSQVVGYGMDALVESTIAFPSLPNGAYTVRAWPNSAPYYEAEACFLVAYRPHTTLASTRRIGINEAGYFAVGQEVDTLGIRQTRQLSPGAFFRWSETEKTPGVYTWYDQYVDNIQQLDHPILGCIAQQQILPWMYRAMITYTNAVGPGFAVGEIISQISSGAQGKVTWICNTNDAIRNSLQVTNILGVFAVGGSPIVGATSGTTADAFPAMTGGPSACQYNNVLAIDRWEQFVIDLVTHYDYVHSWEIMNEPSGGFPVINGDSTMAFYSMCVERAVPHIKAIRPGDYTVILGGAQSVPYATILWNHLDPTTKSLTDALSWHLYWPVQGNSSNMAVFANSIGKVNLNTETGFEDLEDRMGRESGWVFKGEPVEGFSYSDYSLRTAWYNIGAVSSNIMSSLGVNYAKYYYYDARPYHSAKIRTAQFTTLKANDGVKPKTLAMGISEYLFNGGSYGTQLPSPLDSITFSLGGYTNSNWLAVFGTARTNKTFSFTTLSTNQYDVYDMFGNKYEPTPTAIPVLAGCTYVRGIGLTPGLLNTAYAAATHAYVADVTAPTITFEYCPQGTVPALEKHHVDVRYLALDQVAMVDYNYPRLMQYRWKTNSGSYSAWDDQTVQSFTGLASGTYTFTVDAKDTASNISTTSRTFTIP